jgi:superfamily II DNA or RNA helicase
MEYAHCVFGRVFEHYFRLNPDQLPALLFAPDVAGSRFFAQELTRRGVRTGHIDGEGIWLDGEELDNTPENRQMLADQSETGDLPIVTNRFVMREGIDWPWIYHGIFATVFGSLTSYLQAGGRLLRAHPSMDHVIVQDHGGNWWRHGSLNSDREWDLGYNDRIMSGLREKKLREKKEPEPICCPQCFALRFQGKTCPQCGYQHAGRVRSVLQKDGTLKEMKGDIYRRRRTISSSEGLQKEWASRIRAIRKSRKDTVRNMTFAQAEVAFARDHNWQYPPHDWPEMPVKEADWFRPVQEVPENSMTGQKVICFTDEPPPW